MRSASHDKPNAGLGLRTTAPAWTSPIFVLIATLVTAAIVVGPQLFVYATGAHPLAIANESVAYRYFYSYRVWIEAPEGTFLPQGQLVDAFAYLFQCVMAPFVDPATDLRSATFAFGWAIFLANLAVVWTAFFLVFPREGFFRADRVGIAPFFGVLAVVLFGYYASRSGVNLLLAPDYYLFEVSLTALSLAVAFALLQRSAIDRTIDRVFCRSLQLGVVAGAMLCIKISLVGAISFPLTVLLAHTTTRQWTLVALGGVIGMLATIALTMLFALGFDLARVPQYAAGWASFVKNPGEEAGFWFSLFMPWSEQANAGASYQYALGALAAFVAAIVVVIRAGHRPVLMVAIPFVVATAQMVGLVHRPAGTTLWEATLFLIATAVWFLLLPAAGRTALEGAETKDQARWVVVGGLGLMALIGPPLNMTQIIHFAAFRASSRAVWDAHALARETKSGVVIVVPDNNHTAGTVGEALLKGASDFPTWQITGGRRMLDRLVPGLEIRSAFDVPMPGKAVTWVDIVGAPSLAERFPLLAARRSASNCRDYGIENWPWWRRRIVVCPGGP